MSLEGWGQNEFLPLKELHEGDEFILLLNGEYAEDDAGGDVHYIDSESVVPAHYYDEIHP